MAVVADAGDFLRLPQPVFISVLTFVLLIYPTGITGIPGKFNLNLSNP